MIDLPNGTVTFLFTDIEGSTQLWEQNPEQMRSALARHDAILRQSIASHGGHLIKSTGDGIHAAFARAIDAINATITGQRDLQALDGQSAPAPSGELQIRVRMGVHTGEAEMRDGD